MSDTSRPVGDASHRDSEALASEPESTAGTSASAPLFERMCAFVRARYMPIDPRSAGIFRIALGVLLTADTLRHAQEAYALYSNRGVLSNEFHLWRPSSGYQVTIFHAFSTPAEVKVLFALGIVCHLLLLIGYRPRLFAFLSFLFVTGMDQRIPLVENGGYVVVNLAAFWAIFLPTGQRFGLDAWRKSWRARREADVATLNDRSDFAGERKPMVSLLGLIILVNLSLIYFWNVVNKAGWIWRAGNTVHYVLYLKRMVTIIGVWSRLIPEPLLRVTDWAVISCEATICVMIMSPAARRYTRPLAIVLMWLLHGTFGTMMRLGPFSWFLMGCSTLLLSPYQFADLRAFYSKRAPLLEVALAPSASPTFPLSLTLGRALSRLDGYQRIRFVEGEGDTLLSVRACGTDSPFESDPKKTLRSIAHALPFGRYVYPLFGVVTLGAIPLLFARASAHSVNVARFFGLGSGDPSLANPAQTCAVDAAPQAAALPQWVSGPPRPSLRFRKYYAIVTLILVVLSGIIKAVPDNWGRGHFAPWGDRFANVMGALRKVIVTPDADRTVTSTSWMLLALIAAVIVVFWPRPRPRPLLLRDRIDARVFRARELFLTYYALVSMSQSWNENKGIPPEIKFAQPVFIQMTINYPRLFQGWGMFAPNPIQEDGILVVDGYTLDGRRVDPYNGGAPIMDLVSAQGDLGISQLRQDYGNRIRLEQNSLYRDELKGYLMRWHEETENPNDELVAFDVYWVRDRCPQLGSKTPTENDPVALISYRKPGYKRASGLIPIPPQPKIRNAEIWESAVPPLGFPSLKH